MTTLLRLTKHFRIHIMESKVSRCFILSYSLSFCFYCNGLDVIFYFFFFKHFSIVKFSFANFAFANFCRFPFFSKQFELLSRTKTKFKMVLENYLYETILQKKVQLTKAHR